MDQTLDLAPDRSRTLDQTEAGLCGSTGDFNPGQQSGWAGGELE